MGQIRVLRHLAANLQQTAKLLPVRKTTTIRAFQIIRILRELGQPKKPLVKMSGPKRVWLLATSKDWLKSIPPSICSGSTLSQNRGTWCKIWLIQSSIDLLNSTICWDRFDKSRRSRKRIWMIWGTQFSNPKENWTFLNKSILSWQIMRRREKF